MRITLFIFLLLGSVISNAQKYAWSKIDGLGNHGYTWSWGGGQQNVQSDIYGNVYTCGNSLSSLTFDSIQLTSPTSNYYDGYVAKYDRNGKVIWATNLDGSGYEFAHSVAVDTGGNVYVLGWYYSSATIGGFPVTNYGSNTYDCFIAKLNKNGVIQWVKGFGGSGHDYVTGVTVDPSGNVYATGSYQGNFQFNNTGLSGSNNGWCIFLIKFKPDGIADWARKIAETASSNYVGENLSGDVEIDRYNNLYVSGSFSGSLLAGNTMLQSNGANQRGFVMKVLPSNGMPIWGRVCGYVGSAMAIDAASNLYIGGKIAFNADSFGTTHCVPVSSNNIGSDDIFVAKMSSSGTFQWAKRFGDRTSINPGWGSWYIACKSLMVDHAGMILVSGNINRSSDTSSICNFFVPQWIGNNYYNTDAFLLKVNSNGNCEWNARASSRVNNSLAWNWHHGGGVTTDNSGGIYWITNSWYNNLVSSASLHFNNDTTVVKSESYAFSHSPIIWTLREQYIEVDSFSPKIVCPGDTITIWYTKHDPFFIGNKFTAKISNNAGNFFDAVSMGSVEDTGSGFVKGIVPLTTNAGSRFRVRVDGSMPSVYGYPGNDFLTVRAKPVANAGMDDTVCYGDTLQLTGSGGNYGRWVKAVDMNDSTSYTPKVHPDSTFSYILRTTETQFNCYNLDTVITYVISPKVTANSDTLICQGETYMLTAKGQSGIRTKYRFSWVDLAKPAVVLGYDDTLFVNPRITTTYAAVLYDSCSILHDSDYVTVNVRPKLTANPRQDTTACVGETVNIYAATYGGYAPGYSYAWYLNDTVLLTTDSVFSQLLDTSMVFKLKVNDGCSDFTDSANFRAISRGPIQVIPRSDTVICLGQSIYLTATGNGGYSPLYTYSWDHALGNGDSVLISPSFTDDYRVILHDGCTNKEDTGYINIRVRRPLSLVMRPDSLICVGEEVLLHVDGTGGDTGHYTFSWLNVGTGNDLQVSPQVSTTYHVTLTDNCTAQSTQDSVRIDVRPPLTITTMPDTLICQARSASLRAWGSGGYQPGHRFLWSDGIKDTLLPANVPYTVSPSSNAVYRVKLIDNCTVAGDSDQIRVDLRAPIQLNTSGDSLICYGATMPLWAQASGGLGTYTFTWDHIGTGAIQNAYPLQDTVFRVTVSDGCSPSVLSAIQVTLRTPIQIALNRDTLVCPDAPVNLLAVASGAKGNGFIYNWNNSLGTGPQKTVRSLTTTSYILRVEDNCSFAAYDTVTVHISPAPDTDFSVDIDEGCQPLEVNFKADYTTSSPLSKWFWRFGDGSTASESDENANYTFPEYGNFPVMLYVTSDYNCLDSSSVLPITVHPKPVADFEWAPAKPDILNPVALFVNQTQHGTTYYWDFGDGGTSTAFSPSHTFADTGWYDIQLVAVSDQNCLDTAIKLFRLHEVFTAYIPSAFTPNGDGDNDVFGIVGSDILSFRIQVFDRWGGLVFENTEDHTAWNGRLQNVGDMLPGGAYMYKVSVDLKKGGRKNYSGTVMLLK